MAKNTSTGFVSLYRTTDKLEAAYLEHTDKAASNGLKTVGGKQVHEFVATKRIENAVEVYQKTPSKALIPVSAVTGLSAPAASAAAPAAKATAKKGKAKRKPGRPRKAKATKAAKAAPAPAAASATAAPAAATAAKAPAKRRGRPPKAKTAGAAAPKAKATKPAAKPKAKRAAKAKPGGPPARRGRKPAVSEAALADMAALVKAGKARKDVEAMLKEKYKLSPASPTYYVWKRRALGK